MMGKAIMTKQNLKSYGTAVAYLVGLLYSSLASHAVADSVIKIRLSYKIILDPTDGQRPRPIWVLSDKIVTDDKIRNAVEEMNELIAPFWRGYRFELSEIVEIGPISDHHSTGPSQWFHTDFVKNDGRRALKNAFEKVARSNPVMYAWRENAVNIYINQGTTGGLCTRNSIVIGACSARSGLVHLHEVCHYFDLRHTHGFSGHKDNENYKVPGDDEVADTIADLPHWDKNGIAKHTFFMKYDELPGHQKEMVDNVAENIMSRHYAEPIQAELTRLTEGQLDRWTESIDEYVTRARVRDGRTWFVDQTSGAKVGTMRYPFASVNLAVEAANSDGGDIILLRPGQYGEAVTIQKPVTLRATRNGPASIGMSLQVDGDEERTQQRCRVPDVPTKSGSLFFTGASTLTLKGADLAQEAFAVRIAKHLLQTSILSKLMKSAGHNGAMASFSASFSVEYSYSVEHNSWSAAAAARSEILRCPAKSAGRLRMTGIGASMHLLSVLSNWKSEDNISFRYFIASPGVQPRGSQISSSHSEIRPREIS
jgi:hypothetical protein